MDGFQLPQGKSQFEEAVYFLPLSSKKFLVLILPTSKGWKLGRPWSYTVLLNWGSLCWETLTTRPLPYFLIITWNIKNWKPNFSSFPNIIICFKQVPPFKRTPTQGSHVLEGKFIWKNLKNGERRDFLKRVKEIVVLFDA